MRERPIIFGPESINAILAGRKTQTRRIVKPAPGKQSKWLKQEDIGLVPHGEMSGDGWQMHHPFAGQRLMGVDIAHDSPLGWIKSPYGMAGDRLKVRESWCVDAVYDKAPPSKLPQSARIHYLADGPHPAWAGRARSPLHMRRADSRLTLEIVSIRVERLQDISEADAVAEGCDARPFPGPWWQGYRDMGDGELVHQQVIGDSPPGWMIEPHRMRDSPHLNLSAVDVYRSAWNSLHGPGAWELNPWVWVIEFRRTNHANT